MCTNELIASALSKGIFYHTWSGSPRCQEIDDPNPLTADVPPGELAFWIPGWQTTWAQEKYWDRDTVQPWSKTAHSHILGAYDLTTFHSFSYDAITDKNVKSKLANFYSPGWGEEAGGTEEDLEDRDPDVRYFQALNAFVKSAIADVSDTRSYLGAIQNRLEHTINNLDNIAENTAAAESAIRDTDIGTEMVCFSNNSILAQSGQSVLAQANQSKQGLLALLQ